MAEGEAKKESWWKRKLVTPRNAIFTRGVNALAGRPVFHHDVPEGTETYTFKEFKRKKYNLPPILNAFNQLLMKIETSWGTAEKINEKLIAKYRDLGPYTDLKATGEEKSAYDYGSVDTSGHKLEWIELECAGVPFKIPIPAEQRIDYPNDEVPHYLRSYGVNNLPKISEIYQSALAELGEKLIVEYAADSRKVKFIQESITAAITLFGEEITGKGGIANIERTLLQMVERFYSTLDTIEKQTRSTLTQEGPYGTEVALKHHLFPHTFKVIRPGTTKAELRKTSFNKMPNELDWGLDENGWPLEVDNHGHVLLDRYNNMLGIGTGSERKVKEDLIWDIPLFYISGFYGNDFDLIRDSTRDARYNPNTITVMDYIMASSTERNKEWKQKHPGRKWHPEDWVTKNPKDARAYDMKLRGDHTGVIVHDERRSTSNLNPGFDLNTKDPLNWKFLGKRYYYETPEYVANLVNEVDQGKYPGAHPDVVKSIGPRMSTRGIAMFMIDKTMQLEKTVSGMQRTFEAIGRFDWGPRLFGTKLTKTPFDSNEKARAVDASFKEQQE